MSSPDEKYMRQALELANKGKTSPNPHVGAVIVKNKRIIGKGFHARAGADHAEVAALKNCKQSAKGATLYVTLEPCSHHGKTPPCVDAIIKAGIKKVVLAVRDPNPVTRGVEKLKKAGITIKEKVLEHDARELNKAFFKHITRGMPYVSLKAACTLDGKIATASGDSKWISSDQSREWVHKKRRTVDAVLIGAKTLVKDNARLSSRLHDNEYPKRIILGSNIRIPKRLALFILPGETIFLVTKKQEQRYKKIENATVIICKEKNGRVDLHDALSKLAQEGITHILVEGGSEVFSSFIKEELVDDFFFFVSPKLLGDSQAPSFFEGLQTKSIDKTVRLTFINIAPIGEDILIEAQYDRRKKGH